MIRDTMTFLEKVARFTEENIVPIAQSIDRENRCPEELIAPMREAGFFGVPYPETYGGSGSDYQTAFEMLRILSKGSAGIGLLFVVQWMAVDVLLKYGTAYQKKKYLEDMVTGKKIASYAISEYVAGSDAASIKTIATKTEQAWHIKGAKYFVTNGSLSDLFIVACKADQDKGMSLFIVEHGSEGLSITEKSEKMGFRSSSTTNLILSDVKVADLQRIGSAETGMKIALDGLVGGRLGMSAIGVGIAEAAYERTLEYANKRMAYGKKIGKLYAIQEKVADMYIALESARALFDKACQKRDENMDYSLEASVAKIAAGKAANEICCEAIQVMGGHGYLVQNDVERYYRDARLIDIGVGASEVIKMVIGATVLHKEIGTKV